MGKGFLYVASLSGIRVAGGILAEFYVYSSVKCADGSIHWKWHESRQLGEIVSGSKHGYMNKGTLSRMDK